MRPPFLAAAAFPLLLYCFYVPYYAVNDNAFFAMILRGVGFVSAPSEWTVHLNVLLGWTLKSLYALFPGVAWYPGFLTLVLALAAGTLAAVLFPAAQDTLRKILLGTILAALFLRPFLFLDWTTVALMAAISATVAVGAFLEDPDARWAGWCGVLLLGSAGLLRGELLLPGVLAASALLPWKRIPPGSPHREGRALVAGALLTALFVPFLVNEVALLAHPEWKQALRYAEKRQSIAEFKRIRTDDKTLKSLESLGWDGLDLQLFQSWYGGVGRFDYDHLVRLDREIRGFSPRTRKELQECLLQPAFSFHLLILVLLLAWVPREGRGRALGITLGILALLAVFFLFAKLPDRVMGAILSIPVLFALRASLSDAGTRPNTLTPRPVRLLGLAGLVLLLLYSLGVVSVMNRVFRERETGFLENLRSLPRGEDRLLIFWGNGIHVDWVRAFNDQRVFEGMNLYPVHWLQTSPHAEAMRMRFRMEDPVRDLVDREDVSVAPSDALPWPFYERYMKEKHGMTVKALPVVNGRGCQVYRVVSRPPPRIR